MVIHTRKPSNRKRRRQSSEDLVTEPVFLLPKDSRTAEDVTPQESSLMANPVVQETDRGRALTLTNSELEILANGFPRDWGTNTGTNDLGMPNHFGPSVDIPPFDHVQPHPSFSPLIQQQILMSPLQAASKKRSPFWQAFHQFNTKHPQNSPYRPHHAACNLCGKFVNMGRDNSTTTLSQHLRKCNRALWLQLKDTVVVPPINNVPKIDPKEKKMQSQVPEIKDAPSQDSLSSKPHSPTTEDLKQYIQVAFAIRFKDPPEEEWAGLITILNKELSRKLTKDTIRGIFQKLSSRHPTKDTLQQQDPDGQRLSPPPEPYVDNIPLLPRDALVPTSIPLVEGSVNSSVSSQCNSPMLESVLAPPPGVFWPTTLPPFL